MTQDKFYPDLGFKDYRNLQITTSKQISRAAHGLSLNEKRLIALAIAQVDSSSNISSSDLASRPFRVYATDFQKTFNIDMSNCYDALKAANQNLFDRYISFKLDVNGKQKNIKFRWVSGISYVDGEGHVELRFSPDIAEHLTMPLLREFNSLKVKAIADLRSLYSWRTLELINEYKLTGWCVMGLEDVKYALEVPESYSWFDIKRRVLDPSIKEINKYHPELGLVYEPQKRGRVIEKIKFTFNKIEKKQMPDSKKNIKPK